MVSPGDANQPLLKLTSVVKSYGTVRALDCIDLDVHAGEVVALFGASGSGKSTVLRCIAQLERIDGGAMYLDGELLGFRRCSDGLRQLSDREIARQRKRVGMVFQSFNLFPHLTALTNVSEALVRVLRKSRYEANRTAMTYLEQVGLAEKANAYPRQLSGGQQQRVAIARALAMQPRLMLFDEPTSALDPELVGEVLSVIRRLADGSMTLLIVTHEMSFAREVSDRCVFVHGGRVVEAGSTADMFDRPATERLKSFLRKLPPRPESAIRHDATTTDLATPLETKENMKWSRFGR
jgi:polar amino acid transport system ATP-binding protein